MDRGCMNAPDRDNVIKYKDLRMGVEMFLWN